MRSIESEILLIKNSLSGNRTADRRAEEIRNRLRNVVVKDFNELQRGEIKKIPGIVMIVGGDGTINGCVGWFMKEDERPTLVIVGGGTGESFRKSVANEGATIGLKNLTDSDKLSAAILSFRSAVIKEEATGEKSVFVTAAGFGQFEKNYSKYREAIRQLPSPPYLKRKASEALAALTTSISSGGNQEEFLINAYSTDRILHGVKVFPNQALSLNSTNIGLVQIKDENPQVAVAKFICAVTLWRLGIKPPSSIASTHINTVFEHLPDQQGSKATLDGEVRQFDNNTNLTIRRSNTIFPVVALI